MEEEWGCRTQPLGQDHPAACQALQESRMSRTGLPPTHVRSTALPPHTSHHPTLPSHPSRGSRRSTSQLPMLNPLSSHSPPSSAHSNTARPLQGHPTNGSHPPHSYAYKHTVFTLAPLLCALRRRQATARQSATWLPPPHVTADHVYILPSRSLP